MRCNVSGLFLLLLKLVVFELCLGAMEYEKCCDIENIEIVGEDNIFGCVSNHMPLVHSSFEFPSVHPHSLSPLHP